MKTSVFSFSVNDKFPIPIAYRQYKKYMKEEFEYILFNDADNPQMEANINVITSYNNIKCIRVPQNIHKIHNPSASYAETLNWSIHEYAINNNCEIVILSHTDIFPICDIIISNIINNNIIASTAEFRLVNGKGIHYLYPAFTIVNMGLLKNPKELDFSLSPGLDTGGKTKDFVEKNQQLVKFLPNYQAEYMAAILSSDPISKYFEEDIKICRKHGISAGWVSEGFFHYMAGSQWNSDNPTFAKGHKQRMDLFLKYFY